MIAVYEEAIQASIAEAEKENGKRSNKHQNLIN